MLVALFRGVVTVGGALGREGRDGVAGVKRGCFNLQ